MEHRFAISSSAAEEQGKPSYFVATGCPFPFLSWTTPRAFQETHFSRFIREHVRKFAIHTLLRAVFSFDLFYFFLLKNFAKLSESGSLENAATTTETFVDISKSVDKFTTILVDSIVVPASFEVSSYLLSIMLREEALGDTVNFYKESHSYVKDPCRL